MQAVGALLIAAVFAGAVAQARSLAPGLTSAAGAGWRQCALAEQNADGLTRTATPWPGGSTTWPATGCVLGEAQGPGLDKLGLAAGSTTTGFAPARP